VSKVVLKMRVVGASIAVIDYLTSVCTFNLSTVNTKLEIDTQDEVFQNRLQKAFIDESLVTIMIKLKD